MRFVLFAENRVVLLRKSKKRDFDDLNDVKIKVDYFMENDFFFFLIIRNHHQRWLNN